MAGGCRKWIMKRPVGEPKRILFLRLPVSGDFRCPSGHSGRSWDVLGGLGCPCSFGDAGGEQFAYEPGEDPRGAVLSGPACAQDTFEVFALSVCVSPQLSGSLGSHTM